MFITSMNRAGLVILLSLFASQLSRGIQVKSGLEVLRDRGYDVIQGKRTGLITNPTGVDRTLKSTIDILHEAPGVKLVALFGPEHGVRGDFAAGDKIETSVDPRTGVPAYSLYGSTRSPSAEMLKGIDVLVYDIQDIGIRSYTYISTMGLAMSAAAEHGIEFVVLDRPNPLGGLRIEGNLVEEGYTSFVSQFPIPYVYGLTCGELARFLNEEGLLANQKKCRLTVIPMDKWERRMTFEDTGLPWVPTSPHIPEAATPAYCTATGVLGEIEVFSVGIGYTLPFRVFAAPWIDSHALANSLGAMNIPGVLFRPITFKPFYGRDQGKELKGVQIHFTDSSTAPLTALQFYFLEAHHTLYPDKDPFALASEARLKSFDRVCGTDRIRKVFLSSRSAKDVISILDEDIEGFRARSIEHHLY